MKKIDYKTRLTLTINGEKITAPASLFNLLAIYAGEAGDKFNREDCYTLSDEAIAVRDQIHDQLDERYYFD